MRRAHRPLLITLALLALLSLVAVLIGHNGWGRPAENEQAIGEISRWCERVSGGFLREPVNTLGNLGFVISGLAMMVVLARDERMERTRSNYMVGIGPVSVLYASATVFLGPGSMVMHGTHTFFGAWIDNVSMVAYITLPWLLNISEMQRWRPRTLFGWYGAIVVGYAAGYWFLGSDLGIGFELFRVSIPLWMISELLHRYWSPTMRWASGFFGFVVAAAFGITPLTIINNMSEYWWFPLFWLPGLLAGRPPQLRRNHLPWFFIGVGSFLLAYAIWLTGKAGHAWCDPDSLIQAHAIWHLLGAMATWSFFKFLRTAEQLRSPHDAIHELMR